MRLAEFNEFLRVVNFFFRTIAIKPYDEPDGWGYKHTLLDDIRFYIGFANMNLFLVAEIHYVVNALVRKINFLDALVMFAFMAFLILAEFKIINVRRRKHQLTDLMRELYEIFPKTLRDQEAYDMNHYLPQCKRVTISFSILYLMLIYLFNYFDFTRWLIFERWLKLGTFGRFLPYNVYVPWNYEDNWTFYLAYASSALVGYCAGTGQFATDILFCAVSTQVIMHYDYVSRSIEGYDLEANKKTSNPRERQRQHDRDLKFLGGIIAYHCKVLNLSEMLNDVFGLSLFLSFLVSCISLCFVGFQFTVGHLTTEMQIKLFFFLLSALAEIYLICYYGQMLIDVSHNVAYAVYSHNWSNADIRYKRMLVLILQRAQKPSHLQATVFVTISRNTMTGILQISYKFFALLRTMYAE